MTPRPEVLGARVDPTTIPLPAPTPVSEGFWAGCRAGRLLVPRCRACGHQFFPPQPACTRCLSPDIEERECTGRGALYSYTIVWRPQNPAFQVPYIVAIVELDEGWHLVTNLLNCEPEEVEVGMPVTVRFTSVSDDITLPYFVPDPGVPPVRRGSAS
jgi:uncharacterized protein